MRRIGSVLASAFCVALVTAAAPAWKSKQAPQWNEEDAKQILTDSPWAKVVAVAILPELSPEQRRQGGARGGGRGVGLKGLEGITLLGAGKAKQPGKSETSSGGGVVMLRWESALPVRLAEMKAREIGAPELEVEKYAIAVYEVASLQSGQRGLAGELKKLAALRRDGKKDLKPSMVEVLQQANGSAMVVYFFPRSVEITMADKRIEFVAQIDRLYIVHSFYTDEMQFQGRLEL